MQAAALACICEGDRDWTCVVDLCRWVSLPVLAPERHDGVACLIGREQKTSRGIKTDEARCGTLRRLPSTQVSVPFVALAEDGDAVMSTIGAVHETAIRCDGDFSSGAVSGKLGRQRRDDLRWRQQSVLVLPAKGRCRAVEPIQHADRRKLWVCAGAGPRLEDRPRSVRVDRCLHQTEK